MAVQELFLGPRFDADALLVLVIGVLVSKSEWYVHCSSEIRSFFVTNSAFDL